MTRKVVALLPMKENSERVKGKNFRDLAGRPLFRWILDALLEVEEIHSVVINTDARATLKELGLVETERVTIRDRKRELCGDLVSMNSILADDLDNVAADSYIMTHTTNPLISAETIRKGLRQFHDSDNCDSLFSVNKIQSRFYNGEGKAINHDPDNLIRTQDLEPWFEENSCLFYFTKTSFLRVKARISDRPAMFETPPLESFDRDEPHDWDVVAALSEARRTNV